MGQMIPSTGPMAADRRRSVARMMTTTTADPLLPPPRGGTRYSRGARCDAKRTERRNGTGREGGKRPGAEQNAAADSRTRPARWSVANWLDPARLDAQRPRRSLARSRSAHGVRYRSRCVADARLIAANLPAALWNRCRAAHRSPRTWRGGERTGPDYSGRTRETSFASPVRITARRSTE